MYVLTYDRNYSWKRIAKFKKCIWQLLHQEIRKSEGRRFSEKLAHPRSCENLRESPFNKQLSNETTWSISLDPLKGPCTSSVSRGKNQSKCKYKTLEINLVPGIWTKGCCKKDPCTITEEREGLTSKKPVFRIRTRMDPRHFGKLEPDPDPDQHQSEQQDPSAPK